MDAGRLLGSNFLPVHPIRGRTSRLAEGTLTRLRAGIAGQGYVVPGFDGRVTVGATYETVGADDGPGLTDARANQSNLERLALLLDQAPTANIESGFDAVRCVARDRTPFAGAVADEAGALAAHTRLQGAHLADLPRRPGLFCLFALGSRGLSLAPLLGELVASQIDGEPQPVERALGASVDPARFLLRHLRRS
jgi:tRNA 5-methylaminomethyl-2-thiouridine biosynthesis bifunctional protein